ncbi:MAG: hypothetical protein MUO76_06860 [Anaerolineaceae bacterium]|nr:hypothetical protein [Anaerolineaceae bacterium]
MYNNKMMVHKRQLFFAPVILLLFLGLPITNGFAQASDAYYFEETGHWVRGKFLDMFLQADDPLLLFGFPLTDEIHDDVNNVTIQYFQRVRMDLVEEPKGSSVRLVDLGRYLYTPGAPLVQISTNSAVCRTFTVTEKSVCYAFLQFYDAHNGAEIFGNPISELELREGHYVQYFERTRMEWRPEFPPGQRVALTDLGRIYYEMYTIRADTGSNIIGPGVKPQVQAFVSKALIPSNDEQTLFVIAQDQYLEPIEGAMVIVTIHWSDKQKDNFRPPATNEDGISKFSFPVGEIDPQKIIEVEVGIMYLQIEAFTSTWFRVWW